MRKLVPGVHCRNDDSGGVFPNKPGNHVPDGDDFSAGGEPEGSGSHLFCSGKEASGGLFLVALGFGHVVRLGREASRAMKRMEGDLFAFVEYANRGSADAKFHHFTRL